MWKIDTTDAAGSEPSRPSANAVKYYSRALKTILQDWWFNMVQNEIYNTVVRFGISPDKADDNQLGDAIEAATEPKYIALTAGTVALTQTAAGTYPYTIADFTGTGLNTDKIRMLYVQVDINSSSINTAQVLADFPDGTQHDLGNYTGYNSDDDLILKYMQQVPINKAQAESGSIAIEIVGVGTASFTIIGATQIGV